MLKNSIFLYGPSGSGKSTIGKILAKNLNLPFLDLDAQIETIAGMSIPMIFDKESENGFRYREGQVLKSCLVGNAQVVALGGGALTTIENRKLVEEFGEVVVLTAPASILKERLALDSVIRPLLSADPDNQLERLLESRQSHYQSFQNIIDTSQKHPETTAWDIQVLVGRFYIRGMKSGNSTGYPVTVQNGLLKSTADILFAQCFRDPIAVVTDENVGKIYLSQLIDSLKFAGFQAFGIEIPAGEENKTLNTITRLWDFFLSKNVERSSTIIALGGGVIGDLTGFAASTYLRGIPWIGIPTSLLAMVDSCIGGKTAFDLPQGKNLIGSFYPPKEVIVDPLVLQTLPHIEINNGMAEVIKHGIIGDPTLFSNCNSNLNLNDPVILDDLVNRAMAVKIKIIELDPFERGVRAALNFGHTIGHGLELTSNFQLRHGEAVAIGMVAETKLAEWVGFAPKGLTNLVAKTIKTQNLPTDLPTQLDPGKVIKVIQRDKKVSERVVKFSLPRSIGEIRTGIEVEGWEKFLFNQ